MLSIDAPSSVRSGNALPLTVEVATTSATPCLVDLGSGTLTVAVTSGEDPVWSSAHCGFEPGERRLLLGEGSTDAQGVTWPGTRSVEGCAGGQPFAEPGSYRVVVTHTLDEKTLTAEATFTVR